MSTVTPISGETIQALKNPRNDGEYIAGLARGLSVLRVFSKERPELTLSEIAAATNLNVAVVRRCINTLVHLGYVRQVGRRFRLCPEVTAFAAAFLESSRLHELVEPSLYSVTEATGDSASFAVLSHGAVLYLLHVPGSEHGIEGAPGTGGRRPADKTALGRVLLAYGTKSSVQNACSCEAGADAHRPHERRGWTLDRVKKDGFAVVWNESEAGTLSVALPVFGHHGTVLGALGCTGLAPDSGSDDHINTRLAALEHAAHCVEDRFRQLPQGFRALS